MNERLTTVVVGGGPVGLFAAVALSACGLQVRVLEKSSAVASGGSRAIGVHPIAMELFDRLGLADAFLARGVAVRRGHAFLKRERAGVLSFDRLPGRFKYVLSLPQQTTEALLASALQLRDPEALVLGAQVTGIEASAEAVRVGYQIDGKAQRELEAALVIGCDGKQSLVRREAGIRFEGAAYGDSYLMGDYTDETPFGDDAALFLHPEGVVESFPLPASTRRWVCRTDDRRAQPDGERLERIVARRTGHRLAAAGRRMVSGFGTERLLAERFVSGRVVLAGDAAHVISPIGGQGMNLGWVDAWTLARELSASSFGDLLREGLPRYDRLRRRAARRAVRRAEFNMWMGRPGSRLVRELLTRAILGTPLSRLMARRFTMRGL